MKEQYGYDLNPVIEKIKSCSVYELTDIFWDVLGG